ncbi:DUF6527 family protein [Paraburkholderia kururiensis]|uniref:DUF6527 family protein n=1 Tax=Paraburkholderia TaxID=1822464 RepID=UPI003B9F595C
MPQLLLRLWNHALAYFDGWLGRYTVVVVDDLPDALQAHKLYAVGENGQYWLAALRCPCGCGDTIQLPMIEGQRPRWTLTQKDMRLPSISPSVDRTKGCRSHFWVRHGMIHWCETTR